MSSSPLYKQVLKGIALALLAMIQPVSADDEFNLRILEMDTPLENTSTLKNFINDNGLLPGYTATIASIVTGIGLLEVIAEVIVLKCRAADPYLMRNESTAGSVGAVS